ncbi:MAG: hypothetical protein WBS54_06785, partial [Acidobacteriota bacterium]
MEKPLAFPQALGKPFGFPTPPTGPADGAWTREVDFSGRPERAERSPKMKDTELFQLALSLMPPWMVERCAFDVSLKRLDLYIDFERG